MELLYQLNRGWTSDNDLILLLYRLKHGVRKGIPESVCDLRVLYLMIAYCRDVVRGKGERDLSYRIIFAFYQVFPILAIKALHLLFQARRGLPMVGSWCDVKYFCKFVECHSSLGADDPLIVIMASIANRHLSLSDKWIPRERHHPDLFSVFARDFTQTSSNAILSSVKKGLYRKRVSSVPSFTKGVDAGASDFPTWFMGKYVREAVRLIREGEQLEQLEQLKQLERKWRRLLATFPRHEAYGLPIVDLDLLEDAFLHSLGFACLIAEKMGLKRILLAGIVPVWVDISECDGFVEMVRVLWFHYQGRVGSRLGDAIDWVKGGSKYIFDGELLVFLFSERFDFDWRSFIVGSQSRCMPVFWNLGSSFVFPVDLFVDEPSSDVVPIRFIYMSGYASGLLVPFFSNEWRTQGFYKYVLEEYSDWSAYFDLFVSNVTMPFGTMPALEDKKETPEIPDNPSLGLI
jgi:hypothetical protein